MSLRQFVCAWVVLLVAIPLNAQTFFPTDIVNWQSKEFSGNSSYSVVSSSRQQAPYLVGSCRAGNASGLFLEDEIPITPTTKLRWRWRIPATLPTNPNEKTKAGDDFSARVYVIVKRGFFNLSSRAINYVWSSQDAIGEHWPNPFTKNAHMVVVSDNTTPIGQWQAISRNIQRDFRRYHGIDITEIDSLAIMVDCDNHGASREFHLENISLGWPADEGVQ